MDLYKKIFKRISNELDSFGAKAAIIPLSSLTRINEIYNNIVQSETFSKKLYDLYLTRYSKDYREVMPQAESIIIAAYPQKITEISFNYEYSKIFTIIPPTYINKAEKNRIPDTIGKILLKFGYDLQSYYVPEKLTAVLAGLGKYGRNNLCYIPGMGSFLTLHSYITDLPSYITDLPLSIGDLFTGNPSIYNNGKLMETLMMEPCANCKNCIKNCPTGCISIDHFLINAERCLTFFNENTDIFPVWIKENYHHAIIGCIKCQTICPENKEHLRVTIKGEAFTKYETNLLLNNEKFEHLPENTRAKLEKMCMDNYYNVLSGNLRLLINKKTNIF
jgi:epoxyqueuosine reductase